MYLIWEVKVLIVLVDIYNVLLVFDYDMDIQN